MTDEEFLTLDQWEAAKRSDNVDLFEQRRLIVLYGEKHGVNLANVSSRTGTSLFEMMGWLLLIGGAIGAGIGFTVDIGVDVPGSYGGGEVANIDRMAMRELVITVAVGAFISGWIALAAHHVISAIRTIGRGT